MQTRTIETILVRNYLGMIGHAVFAALTAMAATLPRDSMVSFLMLPRRAFGDLPERYYRLRDYLPYEPLPLRRPAVR